jgi:site-specific DNA-methyltransferase (adenine-specific)
VPTVTLRIPHEVIKNLAAADEDQVLELVLSIEDATGPTRRTIPAQEVRPTGPLAHLMQGKLLIPGTLLYLRQPRANRFAMAKLQADGSILVDGLPRPYDSPSKAATAVVGTQANGWSLWRTEEGTTLEELRFRYARSRGAF